MNEKPATYTLAEDEKAVHVMVYTAMVLYWGEVLVKKVIRVSTWLRTSNVPDWIALYNAGSIVTTSGAAPRTNSFSELFVPVPQIMAFHLLPPATEPLDFDPTEPNRKMEQVSALIGTFQVKGGLRMTESSNLKRYLDVTRENYTPLYDAEVTNLVLSAFGPVKTPYILIRQTSAIFAAK